jgi:hypothetical protein
MYCQEYFSIFISAFYRSEILRCAQNDNLNQKFAVFIDYFAIGQDLPVFHISQ